MKVDCITNSYKDYNEDGYGCTENSFWVLDGASALNKHNFTDAENDVYWVVNWWSEYLKTHIDDPKKSIAAIIEKGVMALNVAFSEFVQLDTLSSLDVVSLGISVVRLTDDHLEYFVLGDVEINIKLKTAAFLSYTDTSIKALDQKVIDAMTSDSSRNDRIVFKGFTQGELDLLKTNRSKMNTEEGYYILAHEQYVPQHGIQGTIERRDIEAVMLFSDGFAQLYNTFTLAELFEETEKKGLEKVVSNLRRQEKDDGARQRFQRLKQHDDVTAIRIVV